ncbi:hypothetical protein [Selenihalanaerobacter shriftii]|uniref:Uncharacterized protein n=1 Tax=Selenihalanaerobacter shriftii TaxID=142842 RepID=A0A1T4LHC9_9FIRM|nr:hypothetical protein [Selenihalanaerobacter shriftii]SJZ53834.1 hypothetical protein SAMN02745118_01128 [Selenihalanaerobacter shriftii]
MKPVILSKYLQQNNLEFKEFIVQLKEEKAIGMKYFRKEIDDLDLNSYIQLYQYAVKPNIECITKNKVSLIPFPIEYQSYQKYKNQFRLLEELAIAKISYERKGYRPKQININCELIKETIRVIYQYYDYQTPNLGEEIIWVDLKTDILKTLHSCTQNNLDGIVDGLGIKYYPDKFHQ